MAKFDVDSDLVRKLAGLLAESDLSEIEYALGEERIRVARVRTPDPAPQMVAVQSDPGPQRARAEEGPESPHPGAVTAPMVGTAYMSPEPDAPAFVKVGDRVSEGDTLMIIEAMKVMNQIRAPRAGTVTQILVESGHPVEYGEPLMVLE
ncbi:MAG: acetyl-CoA carboxylase biotin carboxyl carrier protein [Alphaproteobacteria bacterium]